MGDLVAILNYRLPPGCEYVGSYSTLVSVYEKDDTPADFLMLMFRGKKVTIGKYHEKAESPYFIVRIGDEFGIAEMIHADNLDKFILENTK